MKAARAYMRSGPIRAKGSENKRTACPALSYAFQQSKNIHLRISLESYLQFLTVTVFYSEMNVPFQVDGSLLGNIRTKGISFVQEEQTEAQDVPADR
jgi:hypothetical protein